MGWPAHVRGVLLAAISCACLPAGSVGFSADDLKACLATFDGIAWQLPYRPFTKVHRCSWPGGGYNGQPEAQGRSKLELIASTVIPRNSKQSVSTGDYQDAVFTHFDLLFTRHGFERVETRHGEQRGDRFVEFARYQKRGGNGPVLTWESGAANTWNVTMDARPK
jgi:hypothetical protein